MDMPAFSLGYLPLCPHIVCFTTTRRTYTHQNTEATQHNERCHFGNTLTDVDRRRKETSARCGTEHGLENSPASQLSLATKGASPNKL